MVEPWLRGTREESAAVVRGILHALDQAEEDIRIWTADLTAEDFEKRPHGLPSVGFQIRHIARSLDRLLTYAEGNPLDEAQLEALRTEGASNEDCDAVRAEAPPAIVSARQRIAVLSKKDFEAARYVGRSRLQVTLGGLLVHIAEHTQRHIGQLITTSKVVRASRAI